MVSVRQDIVKYDSKKQEVSRTPITLADCKKISKDGLDNVDLSYLNHCIQFEESTKIGRNVAENTYTVIETSFYPCKVDCLVYPGDATYEQSLSDFFPTFLNYALVTESVLNVTEYTNPFSKGASEYLQLGLSVGKIMKKKLSIQQIVLETKDGFLFKDTDQKIGLSVEGESVLI